MSPRWPSGLHAVSGWALALPLISMLESNVELLNSSKKLDSSGPFDLSLSLDVLGRDIWRPTRFSSSLLVRN